MIKRFVFDANSLISANLLPASINRKAYNYARDVGAIVFSEATFEEFASTLIRPKFNKYISLATRLEEISAFEARNKKVKVSINLNACRDPKDNKYLELAVEANAHCIITGDEDLLVLNLFQGIPILKPAEFLERF